MKTAQKHIERTNKMFDPKDIHVVLIGNDRTIDQRINLELLRNHFSFGYDLWITTVYNGNPDDLPSGVGENNFIFIPENRGYGYGALDAFNEGLDFAECIQRPIVALFNFDVWFFREDGFVKWVTEFLESGCEFGAGLLPDHNLPMTDCMIFKKEYLKRLLPIEDKVHTIRKSYPVYQKMYEGTELGFENMEEWMMTSIYKTIPGQDILDIWWKFQRDGAPRYRYTEKYSLGHIHDYKDKVEKLQRYVSNFENMPITKNLIDHIKGVK